MLFALSRLLTAPRVPPLSRAMMDPTHAPAAGLPPPPHTQCSQISRASLQYASSNQVIPHDLFCRPRTAPSKPRARFIPRKSLPPAHRAWAPRVESGREYQLRQHHHTQKLVPHHSEFNDDFGSSARPSNSGKRKHFAIIRGGWHRMGRYFGSCFHDSRSPSLRSHRSQINTEVDYTKEFF